MAKRLIVSPHAERDIAEAHIWYEARSAGLGEYFLRQLDECFEAISRRPMMFEVVLDEYRRALLKKFPYAVYFEISAEQVFVDAVFHCSQDPAKWQARLRGPR